MKEKIESVNKTKTVSFRLSSSLIKELKQEAEIEKINFNALISKILGNHTLWEKYERKVGLLPMTKPFVKYAIQKLTDKEIIYLAEVIEKDTFSDILNFMKGEYTVEDFIEILRTWLNVAWMQHHIEKNEDTVIFKIQHDLGKSWSLYVKTLATELFYDILGKKLEVIITKTTLKLVFPTK
ncbi:MAG: hypothetical protein COA77_07370 [Thaumarchaeota archaeon]|nr:MAG: hypothetical protein COA77_07370 [Nitrososphaerota archaeon]